MSCSVCEGHDSYNCPCCGRQVRTCPECGGTGKTPYLAYDLRTNRVSEVPEIVWLTLPEDEDEARRTNRHTFQFEDGGDRCPACHGDGTVPEDY